ncbi:MAG: succinate dehydrogenase assembly factor 2 [Gammaproteobacteria bacterium]|nr:succinate dehydrogenase assembly factor 2 [Gammaproteobacteria bacterium]
MTNHNRLQWRCRRGMLELDTLLQEFLETQYDILANNQKDIFENLLTYPDQLLFEYLMGKIKPLDKEVAHVVERIRYPVNT